MCVLVGPQGNHDITGKVTRLAPCSLVTAEWTWVPCVPRQTTNSLHDTSISHFSSSLKAISPSLYTVNIGHGRDGIQHGILPTEYQTSKHKPQSSPACVGLTQSRPN